jgi:hypothetical protein
VHKGSTETNKKIKLGFKRKEQRNRREPWSGAPDCLVCHRTVFGVPPDSVRCTKGRTVWTLHLRVSQAPLRYNSPDCPVHQAEQRLTAATVVCKSMNNVRRSQSRRQRRTGQWTVPVQCSTGLSGATWRQRSNGQNLQNPNGWVTWLAHRTVSGGAPDCPVLPSTDNLPNGYVVVEGYKYPSTTTTPSIQVFQTSHSIQELVQSIQDTIQKNQSLSKS